MDAQLKARMDELWGEMQAWPIPCRAAFALKLMHLSAIDVGSDLVDAGVFDPVAGVDSYLVCAIGEASEGLRQVIAEQLRASKGRGRTIHPGERPTPLAGQKD